MSDYLRYGFRLVEDKPQCILCSVYLATTSKTPSKLRRHLETAHPKDSGKPIHCFEGKLDAFLMENNDGTLRNTMDTSDSPNSKLLRASYYSSLTIARNSRPHTLMETTVMSIIVNAERGVLEEDAAVKISAVPHSNNTIKRRIEEMSTDVQFQLKFLLNSSPYFSLQFHESVDVSGAVQLLCYVKYVGRTDVEEKMLFCLTFPGNTTGECLFEAMMKKTSYFNLDWDKCVAICTDGAAAMTGKKVGFVKRILDIAPNAKWSHCMIHRYSLAVKPLPDDLTFVMEDCVSIVNHIKTSSLKTRLFEELCVELGADFVHLLYHTQVRWLSRGKVLERLVFLKDEVYLFLCNDNSPLAHNFDDQVWVWRMCYLADVFALVNDINMEMQGRNSDMVTLQYAVEGCLLKIDYLVNKLEMHEFDAFPLLKAHSANYPPDALTLELFTRHLRDMHILIREYFPAYQEYENEWVISPFNQVVVRNTHLETSLQFALIDLSCNMRMKSEHSIRTSSEFWIFLKDKYPQLALKALRVLMPFPTSYLCELGFSTVTFLKNKYCNRLQNIESDLMLSINSSIQPNIERLVNAKQAHPTH